MAFSKGMERLALVVRWFAWGWLAFVVVIQALAYLVEDGPGLDWRENLVAVFFAGLIPAVSIWTAGWILDGFAKREG